MLNVTLGVLLAFSTLVAVVAGGFLAVAIITASIATVLLALALRSFFRPERRHSALSTLLVPPGRVDLRQVFADAARVAASGEIIVSYTEYRRMYRATLLAGFALACFIALALLQLFLPR